MITDGLIRPALDSDGVAVAALIEACFGEYPGCLFDWSEFPELRAPASHFADKDGRFWVAGEDLVLGCIAATPKENGHIVELTKMYVAGGARGTGLAQALFGKLRDFAQEIGAGEIMLWTDTRFTRAHAFYEKLGFQKQDGQRFLGDISDTFEFHYRLSLTGAGS